MSRNKAEEGRPDCWKAFSIDRYISDGDTIECGDKQIKVVATPGHTEGCMSYIFPVLDKELQEYGYQVGKVL